MKIIDWERKGNVVRFYLGENDMDDWWGDDWDDAPYEHNAGTVYGQYVAGYIDAAYPFDVCVTEPADDWAYGGNSPYCKEDFQRKDAPFLLIVPKDIVEENWGDPQFSKYAGSHRCHRFFMGDDETEIAESGAVILERGKGAPWGAE